ncbi:unnamed protein product [Adineta steineri]|uniref:Dyp-type peroxidase n=1 Tax=Adineta steineri TaxID=433720 RepID=A0A813NJH6_9BILA|nr:unnamed protein product [Adineta steineri]CAF3784887.1 unnamed protein product [Adineta steineri]
MSSTPSLQQKINSSNHVTAGTLRINEKSYFDKLKAKHQLKKSSNVEHRDSDSPFEGNNLPKSENVQSKITDTSNTYYCQTGILTPFDLFEHALYIILHLSNEGETAVIDACRQLPKLKSSLVQSNPNCRLETTLGIGYSKTREWLARANIPFPKSFIEFQKKEGPTGKTMPSTGGDLLLHIRSNRKDLCFEIGRRFYQSIPDTCTAQLDDTFGYAYMSSKTNGLSQDFIGFEDGNENPNGNEQRAKAALIGKEEDEMIHVGGSFALTQKWKHNLIKWNGIPQDEQEAVVGRTKGEDSKKIRPKQRTSHVARTDLKENGVDIKVVRQSLPYGDLKEHGLFFISYASDTKKHEKQLDSMVGMDDNIYDRIMDFSTPITGNYWFIPSLNVLEKIFQ